MLMQWRSFKWKGCPGVTSSCLTAVLGSLCWNQFAITVLACTNQVAWKESCFAMIAKKARWTSVAGSRSSSSLNNDDLSVSRSLQGGKTLADLHHLPGEVRPAPSWYGFGFPNAIVVLGLPVPPIQKVPGSSKGSTRS